MKKAANLALLLVPLALLISSIPTRVMADTQQEVRERINRAVCLNDWNTAITETSRLIGSSDITSAYRDILNHVSSPLPGI